MLLRTKLIFGFTSILLLLVGSTLTFRNGMEEMGSRAKQMVLLEESTALMMEADISLLRYIMQGNAQDSAQLRKQIETAKKKIVEAEAYIYGEDMLQRTKELVRSIDSVPAELVVLEEKVALMQTQVASMIASVTKGYDALKVVIERNDDRQRQTFADERLEGGVALALANENLWRMRNAVSSYRINYQDQQRVTAEEASRASLAALDKALGIFTNDQTQALVKVARQGVADYSATFSQFVSVCAQRATAEQAVRKHLVQIVEYMQATIAISNERLFSTQESTASMTLMVSVAALFLGLVVTILLIRAVTGPIGEALRFARQIASGDLFVQINTKRSDEFGQLSKALQAIPDTLRAILNEYKSLEETISSGFMTAEGNASRFSGEFATLVNGTNDIIRRFGLVLDSLPSPVVMLDKNLKASYLNKVAKDLAGTDFVGKTCKELFEREDFNTSSCGLRNAVESGKSAAGVTVAHPRGKRMDISYTAIPMFDAQHKLSCVLQLILDLTAVKDGERTMRQVAHEATAMADRVAAASQELSSKVEQVSRGAEMQRDRVETTATAMNEMNATVMEVAKNAGNASEQTESTRKKAEDGAQLVNKVVAAINTVNKVAQNLQTSMAELGQQAESISGVMNVISDIADQTNLLALNAAIEAARAGEAGRGFAVVADEVRKLAEKTMGATQEVGSNIHAIQTSARNNVEEVGQAVKSVGEATDLANSSGQALHEIVTLAAGSSAVAANIATAAEQQSATSEEINRSLEEVNRIVIETAEGMVQSSAAVQELSQTSQELKRVMERLR